MSQARGLRASNALFSSLPRNWPKSTEAELQQRPQREINIGAPQDYIFNTNFVKTSKYEWWDFLPKFLLEELNPKTKVANCYFLIISALQCFKSISNTNGYPTVLIPLSIVMSIDALFQIIEDISRHRSDLETNSSFTQILDRTLGDFVKVKWLDVQVGDIVKICQRERVPADIVILSVAEKSDNEPRGICYVETKSLDGETNLKIRTALPITLACARSPESLCRMYGKIEMEHPNKLIDSFSGVIDLVTLGKAAIHANNVLLRGCVLRNTDYAYGIVVNSGHDTKIMMSCVSTKAKSSNLENRVSLQITRIAFMLLLLCFVGAIGNHFMSYSDSKHQGWYLPQHSPPSDQFVVMFFYYFLLHATFIPVSLYVSMALVRFYQSYFMMADLSMYYEQSDMPMKVRTMTLNEDLGQISHIFSDKTGTLTRNSMDFRKASIGGVSYGLGITEIGRAAWQLQGKEIPQAVLAGEAEAQARAVPHVSFFDPAYDRALLEKKAELNAFFRILAICHDVVSEHDEVTSTFKLSASNPDDEALVCAAKYFGFSFIDRRDERAVIKNGFSDTLEEVSVLETIEFSSKRKRMAVIIREPRGTIHILAKGADSAMLPRLRRREPSDDAMIGRTYEDLRSFSVEGLRCLVIAQAELSAERYDEWALRYHAALTDLSELEKKKLGEENAIETLEDEIERDLTLVGATAIEDRLQEGVPECIALLSKAGLKIWMLTGDKEETAINIAIACNLVKPLEYMHHIIVNTTLAPTAEDIEAIFERELQNLSSRRALSIRRNSDSVFDSDIADASSMETGHVSRSFRVSSSCELKPCALIIDGAALLLAMADEGGAADKLMAFSSQCDAVVACRVSPDQKRALVRMVKHGQPNARTLSIGDGANDVPMIQEAHVGVGIAGEEGMQAVNASDYALAQFRFLAPLLLKHGRYNYIRMCNLVCFMFYKNILMSCGQFWFNFSNRFTGQKYYTEGAIQLFNLLFTALPIIFIGVYDMDIMPSSVMKYPQVYQAGVRHAYFTNRLFWNWILQAVLESILLSVAPLFFISKSERGPGRGNLDSFWASGALCFSAVVVVANIKTLMIMRRWYWFCLLAVAWSVLLWPCVAFFIDAFTLLDYNFFGVWSHLTRSTDFWLALVVLVVLIFIKDLALLYSARYGGYVAPSIVEIIQASENRSASSDTTRSMRRRWAFLAGLTNAPSTSLYLETCQQSVPPSPKFIREKMVETTVSPLAVHTLEI